MTQQLAHERTNATPISWLFDISMQRVYICGYLLMHRFVFTFVHHYPGETFTHSHLSCLSTILYQLPTSTTVHSILRASVLIKDIYGLMTHDTVHAETGLGICVTDILNCLLKHVDSLIHFCLFNYSCTSRQQTLRRDWSGRCRSGRKRFVVSTRYATLHASYWHWHNDNLVCDMFSVLGVSLHFVSFIYFLHHFLINF